MKAATALAIGQHIREIERAAEAMAHPTIIGENGTRLYAQKIKAHTASINALINEQAIDVT